MVLPKLYMIIPLFNEGPNVGTLVESIKKLVQNISSEFSVTVLFVDDGSSDNTVSLLKKQGQIISHTILKYSKNRGPGYAFGTAFEYLSDKLNTDDWVLTMEGDNTSEIKTIEHMLTRRKEGYDVVLASPYLFGGGFSHVTLFRMFISQIANGLVRIILGVRGLVTFSCFLRLYNTTAITQLQNMYGKRIIQFSGFESMVELLAKITLMKARISEVETRVDWGKRRGKSKMKIIKTSLGYFKLFFHWPKIKCIVPPS